MKNEFFHSMVGGWLLAACYSWIVRTVIEVPIESAWHWGPIATFMVLVLIGAAAEEETRAEIN